MLIVVNGQILVKQYVHMVTLQGATSVNQLMGLGEQKNSVGPVFLEKDVKEMKKKLEMAKQIFLFFLCHCKINPELLIRALECLATCYTLKS